MRAVAVHVTRADGTATVGEQDRHLMQAFWRERPEVPHGRRRPQVGLRVTLLRVNEIREF